MRGNPSPAWSPSTADDDVLPLGALGRGFCGVVVALRAPAAGTSLEPDELERRLLEIGFVEGARVEILHEGAVGRDPIAVRLDDTRVALRRREANAVMVQPDILLVAAE